MQKFFRIENVKCFHFLMVCSSLIVFFLYKNDANWRKGQGLEFITERSTKDWVKCCLRFKLTGFVCSSCENAIAIEELIWKYATYFYSNICFIFLFILTKLPLNISQ